LTRRRGDLHRLQRRAGDSIDKILSGAKPADLPVDVNLIVAKALGPRSAADAFPRADEVIE